MSQKAEIVAFNKTMKDLLNEYGESVIKILNASVEKTGKETRKKLRKSQAFADTGTYREGWSMITEKHRAGVTSVIIANTGAHGGLAHLLEHGHPIRNSEGQVVGRFDGREHIAPIAEEMQTFLVDEVEQRLGDRE